jgi:hypothetical protein
VPRPVWLVQSHSVMWSGYEKSRADEAARDKCQLADPGRFLERWVPPEHHNLGRPGTDQVEQLVVIEARQRAQPPDQLADHRMAEGHDLPSPGGRSQQEAGVFLPRAIGTSAYRDLGEIGASLVKIDVGGRLGTRQDSTDRIGQRSSRSGDGVVPRPARCSRRVP